jgi:CDP-4-dehydro-6-deoxyglucose reductase
MQACLITSSDLAPEVRQFVFEAIDSATLDFTPGQFVSVTEEIPNADGSGTKSITRAYSIASAPDGSNRFELCLNRVGGGRMSPHLFGLQPGDTVQMTAPLGTFTLRDHALNVGHHSIMIATGTGVAPFRAMLQRCLQAAPHARFSLLFGVRYESHLLYRDEFQSLAERYANFRFIPTVSRPTEHWTGKTGHVQEHLEEALNLGHSFTGVPAERPLDFYLCGLKPMVDGVRAILKEQGFDRKQIRYEKYD